MVRAAWKAPCHGESLTLSASLPASSQGSPGDEWRRGEGLFQPTAEQKWEYPQSINDKCIYFDFCVPLPQREGAECRGFISGGLRGSGAGAQEAVQGQALPLLPALRSGTPGARGEEALP